MAGLVLVVVFQFSQWLAPYVPFAWERQLERQFVQQLIKQGETVDAKQKALQRIADRLVQGMNMPSDITVQVYFVDSPTVNAIATLGGNIVIFQGLLDRLPSEDALAMVLGHEIAHVKNRDVLASLGGGVMVSLAASLLLGDAGAVGKLVGDEVLFATLHYSREKEAQADLDAFEALVKVYGHGGGAKDLFDVFLDVEQESGGVKKSDLLISHPLTSQRFDVLDRFAQEKGWSVDLPRQPLSGPLSIN